eukprot:Gregarina_sp_Pseudo_9__837@NODE_1535_length_1512_cov_26_661236_g1422_i0_p1_GENE_NODE_1535_length_1512_cov_26_661236_g1422_i0NODE_1535_length_1512_cov_26_661236_g1422_i0_p1_ORF_typecomplete_len337_score102_25HABP4_PAIRBP1/PF04774_15/1_8e04HABP4_PAIRBP1/PF04774_15/8_4e16HABP4_PAIRBP1/PF04774_15/5_2e03IHABP4_N/PF16174_5/0_00035IHABP4_N/PF16174_5/5_8e02_NODE_1535_length_1512_cov_26_661236_g1422_i02861296
MPQHYTVRTTNAFALLDESDSEERILSKPEVEVPEAAAPKVPAAKAAPREEDKPQRARNSAAGGARERAPRRQPRAEGGSAPTEEAAGGETASRRAPLSDRRGGRRGSHPDRTTAPGKREFDRHSGTGRGTEIKRAGAGSYNWGVETDVPVDEKAAAAQWPDVEGSPVAEEGAPKEEPNAEAPAPTEEGPKTKSYAAYLAEMEEKKKALLPPSKGEVTPSEDPAKLEKEGYSVYTKETAINRKETVESDGEGGDRKPRTVHLAEIAEQSGVHLQFQSRGGNRGGRGRGGDRPARGGPGSKPAAAEGEKPAAQPAPAPSRREINLADSAAFPTLQAH